jgi:uncharacterized membrane protein
MKSKYLGLLILFLLLALNFGLSGYYYAVLPARVASEFDLSGEPKTWMPKASFVIFNFTLLVVLPIILVSLGWICTKLPKWMLDLPHKDYWLAPERKAETAASLFLFMLWLAVGMELFVTSLVGLVYRANLGHPEVMQQTPLYLIGSFVAFMIGWIIRFYGKFRRVPPSPPAPLPMGEGRN